MRTPTTGENSTAQDRLDTLCVSGQEKDGAVRGMRGKFVLFLEREAERTCQSLWDVTRRGVEEPSGEFDRLAAQLSDELDELEELLRANCLRLKNRRGPSAVVAASSQPGSAHDNPTKIPAHWRARARRDSVFPSRPGSSATANNSTAQGRSLSVIYCDKVEERVLPVLKTIDRALGRLSCFVHGPLPTIGQLQREQHTQQQMREVLEETRVSSPLTLRSPQTRSGIAGELWGVIACGVCKTSPPKADVSHQPAADVTIGSSVPTMRASCSPSPQKENEPMDKNEPNVGARHATLGDGPSRPKGEKRGL